MLRQLIVLAMLIVAAAIVVYGFAIIAKPLGFIATGIAVAVLTIVCAPIGGKTE